MKPSAQVGRNVGDVSPKRERQFPLIDWSYQIYSPDRFGSSGSPPPSFWNISRDYFQHEARRHFLAEVAFFLIMAAIWAGAFIEGARVIIHFLYLPAA